MKAMSSTAAIDGRFVIAAKYLSGSGTPKRCFYWTGAADPGDLAFGFRRMAKENRPPRQNATRFLEGTYNGRRNDRRMLNAGR
jgi:hypothetical protein